VYVDDLVITGADRAGIVVFKEEMTKAFKMSDLGLLWYYLGIKVRQNTDGITLNQGAYALKILERAGLMSCNPHQTLVESRLKLSKCSSEPLLIQPNFTALLGAFDTW
jgi:hypothetical protein